MDFGETGWEGAMRLGRRGGETEEVDGAVVGAWD